MQLYERVKGVAKNFFGSDTGLAKALGIPQSTFSAWLNEKREDNLWPHLAAITIICPQVSREWLYFGEGEMLKPQTAGVPPLRVAVPPMRPAVAPTPDDGDLAQKLLEAYAQNARLAEELVRANEERRRLQELLGLDKDAGAAHMPTSAPGALSAEN